MSRPFSLHRSPSGFPFSCSCLRHQRWCQAEHWGEPLNLHLVFQCSGPLWLWSIKSERHEWSSRWEKKTIVLCGCIVFLAISKFLESSSRLPFYRWRDLKWSEWVRKVTITMWVRSTNSLLRDSRMKVELGDHWGRRNINEGSVDVCVANAAAAFTAQPVRVLHDNRKPVSPLRQLPLCSPCLLLNDSTVK